jgi:hypothetical protein
MPDQFKKYKAVAKKSIHTGQVKKLKVTATKELIKLYKPVP